MRDWSKNLYNVKNVIRLILLFKSKSAPAYFSLCSASIVFELFYICDITQPLNGLSFCLFDVSDLAGAPFQNQKVIRIDSTILCDTDGSGHEQEFVNSFFTP